MHVMYSSGISSAPVIVRASDLQSAIRDIDSPVADCGVWTSMGDRLWAGKTSWYTQ